MCVLLWQSPFWLDACILSRDAFDVAAFELQQVTCPTGDSFLFRCDDSREAATWLRHVYLQTKHLGAWRRRRNALPDIRAAFIKHKLSDIT